jgi:hypothetical protein
MRAHPLSKEEKAEVEALFRRLQISPPAAGHTVVNFDAQGKVANAETRVVWR